MKKEHRLASDLLENVLHSHHAEYISLFEIKNALHERGFGLLMIVFTLPLCIPILPPGMTAIPSIPILLFSMQMMAGQDSPWLPQWVGNKTLKFSTLTAIIRKSSPYLKKVERLLHTRLEIISSRTGERIIGLLSFLCAISVLIPFPLTNFIPSIGVLVMSFGLLGKDGLAIILGMLISIFGLVVSISAMFIGQKAVMAIIHDFL